MIFDIQIENWPIKKREPVLFKLFDENSLSSSNAAYHAFSLLFELINKEKGLWKDKEVSGLDACWFSVKVNKNDILYFIDEVNLRCMSEHQLNFTKKQEKDGMYSEEKEDVMTLDNEKYYTLTAIES